MMFGEDFELDYFPSREQLEDDLTFWADPVAA